MPLVTLLEVKEVLGLLPADTSRDSVITQSLPFVDQAIKNHCHRPFEVGGPTEPREFPYEETGIHTVDDFQHGSISAVSVVDAAGTATALDALAWVARPLSALYPVGWWLETRPYRGPSPEMGFLRNEDVLAREYGWWRAPLRLRVTATWGWTAVPGDVKQAAIWTTISFIEAPKPYIAEAIAAYSRTSAAPTDAIPKRARELLSPHVKI